MDRRGPPGAAYALALAVAAMVATTLWVGLTGSSSTPGDSPFSASGGSVRAFAAFGGLHVVGMTPRAVTLGWPASTDLLFSHYDVEYSSSGSSGPWSSIRSLSMASDTSFFHDGLVPSASYSWRVVELDTLGFSSTSNVVSETQPSAPQLTATLSASTSAQLGWTNAAQYGATIAFVAYSILSSVGASPSELLATISDVSTRAYTALALTPGTTYLFSVETTDRCAGAANCPANGPTTNSSSSPSSVSTPFPLQVTATATAPSIVTGHPENFTCAASGGVPPYSFAWTFGDGATGQGSAVSHVYSSTGNFSAQCTATDFLGNQGSGSTAVTVTAPAGGGGGSGGGSGNGSHNGSEGGRGNGTGNGTGTSHPPPPTAGHTSHVSTILFSSGASWLVAGAVLASVLLLLVFAIPHRRRLKRTRGQNLPPGMAPEMPMPPSNLPIAAVPTEAGEAPPPYPSTPWVPPGVDDRIDFDLLWQQRDHRTTSTGRRTGKEAPDSNR